MATETLKQRLDNATGRLFDKIDQVIAAGGDISSDPEILQIQTEGNRMAAGLECTSGVG